MASSYTTSLGIELQATGENANTWGDKKVRSTVGGAEKPSANVLKFSFQISLMYFASVSRLCAPKLHARHDGF